MPPEQLADVLAYLQNDPVRSVRVTAAELAIEQAEQSGQPVPDKTLAELINIQQQLAGRPEAHYSLASLLQLQPGVQQDAVAGSLRHALHLAPGYTPALIAQAEMIEASSSPQSLNYLLDQIDRWPENFDLHYALGLAQVRRGDLPAAIEALSMANSLAPDNDYYAYVLAIAQHDQGDVAQAQALLRAQLHKNPRNRQLRLTLLQYLDTTNETQAQERALLLDQWYQQNPYDPLLQRQLKR